MSLDFKFELGKEGWVLVNVLYNGYKEHKTTYCNKKDIRIWEDLDGNLVAELDLTQGKTTLVDYCDLEDVCKYNWIAAKDGEWGYRAVKASVDGKSQLLHRLLYQQENLIIDHINNAFPNSYALDNRSVNIRHTDKNTHNVRKYKSNSSGHSNIIYCKGRNKLVVQVRLDKKAPYVPYYDKHMLEDALLCRDLFKIVLHEHKGHLLTEEDYREHSQLVIDLFEKKVSPTTKPEKDVVELFRQITKKNTLSLEDKIVQIKDRL